MKDKLKDIRETLNLNHIENEIKDGVQKQWKAVRQRFSNGDEETIDTETSRTPTMTIKKGKIIDRWETIIQGGSGKGEMIFSLIEQLLEESEAPGIAWQPISAQPSAIKGLVLGKKRDYLMVTSKGVSSDYRMYTGARDYGVHLDVTWFLVEKPPFWKKIIRFLSSLNFWATLIMSQHTVMDLDLFDEQDLRAYVTITHHCLLQAVEAVMEELGQDTSKIDRKSKGVLEVW